MNDLARAMREYVRARIVPLEPRALGGFTDEVVKRLEEVRDEVRERGWWAPQLSEELGGMGLSLVEFAPISEALGYSPLAHYCFGAQAPDAGNIELLAEHASDEQRQEFLVPLAVGETRSCFAMTEPATAGSDPRQLAATARLEDGEWVIDGHKWFTTGADGSDFAIAMVVTEPETPSPYLRASMILVPTTTPGFRVARNIPVMGESGAGWASHSEVLFEGCRVPESHLLGTRGFGFAMAQQRLGPGRIHHCMRWIGIAERALEMMCRRAMSRDVGGKPLSHRQTIQNWIAEARVQIEASRLMVLDTAARIERDGQRAARVNVSMIKWFVADAMLQTLDRAIQTHGALGLTDDTILAWFYRHERAARIYDGPDEVHKKVVARKVLESFADPVD